MILAGGTGEKLSVLTGERAKTAVPFGGRYRIIDFVLSNCVHSGINDIAILAQYSPKSLIDHIRMGKPWDLDRRTSSVSILQPTYRGEAAHWYLGTADALYQNIEIIRNSRADHVLVLSGDQVYVMDYRKMARKHRLHEKPVTIAVTEVRPSQRSRFGMVGRSKGGLVTSFKEKPESSSYRMASLGIYLFDRSFLLDVLESGCNDIVFDILMPAIRKREVAAYEFEGYWEDIGSITSYYRASLRLLRHRSMITDSSWPVLTRGTELPPALFGPDSSVIGSIIADGCVIRGKVRGSILFPGARIEKDAVVEDSILFSSSVVGGSSVITKAILDKSVSAGAGSRIGGGRRNTRRHALWSDDRVAGKNSAGITVIGKGAAISRGKVIPAGALIRGRSRI
jgi:glucose-1-phosphate adenylyltransferase